jgi:hypothetical protein
MSLILSGTDGLSDIDGTAATPAIRGTDANTGIFFPAADTIAFSEGGAEVMRIDSSGRLLVNQTANYSGVTSAIELSGTTGANQPAINANAFTGTTATSTGYFLFNRSRGSSVGTNTIVASGDRLGMVRFQGANGTDYSIAAEIYGEVDGTPGASNDMPGRIVFATTPDGSGAATERMRIDSSGNVKLSTAGTSILNSSGNKILNQTGSVLQVITATSTSATIVSSNTFTDLTGFSASITPSSTSNKVLIMINVNAYVVSNANGWGFQITDGSNNVIVEPLGRDSQGPFGYYISGADGANPQYGASFSYQYLWSPGTTSAVTVKLKGRPYNSVTGSAYFNQNASGNNNVGSIVLMEITA